MVNVSTTYVDREEASEILKVSTRTVDRYVRKYRFKTRKDGRRVLIRRVDVDRIIQDHIGQFIEEKNAFLESENSSETASMNPAEAVQDEAKLLVKDLKVEAVKKTEKAEKEQEVYQNLYYEAKKELKEKQERLDAATYRVGQLEAQVKSMVPMLDYTRKEKELKEANIAIEQKEIEKTEMLQKMEKKIQNERLAKWIYLSLAGILLVVEPILFLMWAFS